MAWAGILGRESRLMSEPLNPLDFVRPPRKPEDDVHSPGKGSTGPRTPEGKAISSQNRLSHGLRSKQIILPDESQEDFDALKEKWLKEFRPDTEASINLVDKLIMNDWLDQRAERRLLETEMKLAD